MTNPRNSQRAEKHALREKMRSLGFEYREIAVEFARRYNLRPRTAWREAYGWSQKQAAERLNAYAGRTGLDPEGAAPMSGSHLCEMEAWPGVGTEPAGRRPRPYVFALLASVYGCAVPELIDLADREHLPPGDLLVLEKYTQSPPVTVRHPPAAEAGQPPMAPPSVASLADEDRRAVCELQGQITRRAPEQGAAIVLQSSDVAYRWIQESGFGSSWIEREVLMTAHEGSDHAERAEQRDIGDATLEQLRADVIALSRELMTSEPFPLFLEMRRVRSRMYAALDRRLWPRDETELYFLCGVLNCLMAVPADDLGYPQAAEELVRAGWAYATVIDHRPLMAHLRLELAGIAFWRRPRQSLDLAASGLRYLSDGPNAAQLHLQQGRAAGRLGDADAARRSIAAASEAREREHQDDLLNIGGEFGFSRATQQYMAGAALVEIPGAEAEAISTLQQATDLYAAGPEPGEHHGYGCEALAHVDLATARLRAGELDGAAATLAQVLSLPSAKRIDAVPQRLSRVRSELAGRRFQGSPLARSLDEQIEEFSSDTIVGALHDLPASSG